MKIQRESSNALHNPSLLGYQLPTQILERATDGLRWVILIAVVSEVVLTAIDYVLRPGFATAWAHPALPLSLLALFLLSVGFIVLQRSGWLSKQRLLDLGMAFQVAVA